MNRLSSKMLYKNHTSHKEAYSMLDKFNKLENFYRTKYNNKNKDIEKYLDLLYEFGERSKYQEHNNKNNNHIIRAKNTELQINKVNEKLSLMINEAIERQNKKNWLNYNKREKQKIQNTLESKFIPTPNTVCLDEYINQEDMKKVEIKIYEKNDFYKKIATLYNINFEDEKKYVFDKKTLKEEIEKELDLLVETEDKKLPLFSCSSGN